jgi:hypothetical protein
MREFSRSVHRGVTLPACPSFGPRNWLEVRPDLCLGLRMSLAVSPRGCFSLNVANMKITIVIVIAIACIWTVTYAADEKPAPDAVVVKVLDTPLPSEKDKKDKFLWDSFANKPNEQKFNSYTTEKWKQTFEIFAAALVKKAGEQKLDSPSLQKALDLILKDSKDKIAYLPVGAYQTTLDGKLVWIVTVKWEYPSMAEEGQSVSLEHIRAFVFDQKTLKQVGFITCG